MEIALRIHVVQRILSNISLYTGPIFTIFSPYESSLCTDYGSVPYFPRNVKERCHGNQNNVVRNEKVMKLD